KLSFVPDEDMVREISAAEAVVLPYSEMNNSGVLLVALSLGIPVIVPKSPTNESISREVGAGWVIQYDEVFDEHALRRSLDSLRTIVRSEPNLRTRDWRTVASMYASAFRDATSGSRIQPRRHIYVNAGGQRDNIGDSLLRRAYLDALRPAGQLHVYTG